MVSLLQDQARTLSRYGMKKHLRILPMYSGLPYADQMKVFERVPSSVRKVKILFLCVYMDNPRCKSGEKCSRIIISTFLVNG